MRDTGLTERFEDARPRLRAVAYRMLGSVDDAEDAVQEAWLRLSGDDSDVDNLDAWLTTVVARICLNVLRSRRVRREEELVDRLPDPLIDPPGEMDPEHQALLADSVGLALFVVLDTLPPDERLALVLHDVFAVPFAQIAPIVDRSPEAARKLASRARRRIQQARPQPDGDLAAQREIVDAFFAAGRAGDFERLVALLHPDVVLRGDFGGREMRVIVGSSAVAKQAKLYGGPDREARSATVNGVPGAVIFVRGRPVAVMAFIVADGKVTEIDALADPPRIARLDLSAVS
ncbi:sigma-70 family RNA polymerase sigma factor [Mycobacterium sp.]|jgi:RNA polymerase sigma-70 factor (ECF subfamily)|uniref:sigma-70 family RNA polymerase sigma factor n=1 Tax=Mycobacterium sp. TaxID=1785 RepID=UPI002D6232F0|nr:sigma-70 family RNA polymerase sigma factor [Mycobacterium sp.]HZA10878.1 sigma-70 family RNA polymerase sigma factor [Mycobacterium sp.]